MYQRCCQAFLLLLALSVVSKCSAKQPDTFAEWLSAKKKNSTAAVQSDSYEPHEYMHQCLKEIAFKNCRSPEAPGMDYFESGVTCCDARSNSGNSLGSSNAEVGTCKFSVMWLTAPINEAPGVSKWGEFEAQCYMNAAAGTCGHPFCDQMVLEAAGGIYWAEDIVLASKPPTPLIDDSCGDSRRTASSPATKKGGKRGASKPNGALAGPKAEIAKMSEPTLHSGDAWIFFGPMSINSRVHDVKTTHGWFEYVYGYIMNDPISEADAEGRHIVDPLTYSLKFYKPSGGY